MPPDMGLPVPVLVVAPVVDVEPVAALELLLEVDVDPDVELVVAPEPPLPVALLSPQPNEEQSGRQTTAADTNRIPIMWVPSCRRTRSCARTQSTKLSRDHEASFTTRRAGRSRALRMPVGHSGRCDRVVVERGGGHDLRGRARARGPEIPQPPTGSGPASALGASRDSFPRVRTRSQKRALSEGFSRRAAGALLVASALSATLATEQAFGDTPDAAKATSKSDGAAPADPKEPKSSPKPKREPQVYDLPQILALADKNHPNIAGARAELAMVRAQLDEAHWAPFSQFKMTGGVALAPEIRGNNVFSPNTDVSLTTSLGVAWKIGIEGVLPLWTFGKIGNLWDAADANVKVHEAGVEKERDVVRLEVRRAYFALQLARDAQIMLGDVKKQLDSAEARLTEKVEKEDADPIDLLRLQTFSSEIGVRQAEADKFVTVALSGLRFYTGVADLEIPDAPLAAPKHQLAVIDRYFDMSQQNRPELAQARWGLAAREAQTRLAESNFYPDVGLGLSVGLSAAPEITDQLNPFVADPANYFHYGAALVFQWNLDFLPRSAQLRQAEAQLAAMRATARYATGGVKTEIEIAYADAVDWKKRHDAYEKSAGYAKKWLIRVQSGIDIGTIEDKELIDPAKAYALARFNTLNATMELDVAIAKLARATGWDEIAPDGT